MIKKYCLYENVGIKESEGQQQKNVCGLEQLSMLNTRY